MKRRSFFQAATALFAAVALPFREVAARVVKKFAPDTAWTHIKPEAVTDSVFRVATMKNPAVQGWTGLRMQKPYPETIPEQSQIVSVRDNTATVGPEQKYSRDRYSTEKQERTQQEVFVTWDEELAKLAKDKQA